MLGWHFNFNDCDCIVNVAIHWALLFFNCLYHCFNVYLVFNLLFAVSHLECPNTGRKAGYKSFLKNIIIIIISD